MSLFRDMVFKTLYLAGIGNFLLSRNRKKGKIPVLVFHKITPENDEVWPGIHPHKFESILKLLQRYYELRPLSDLVNVEAEKLKNACFVTFDDGYKDFLEHAYPLLKKHNTPASLFVLPYDLSNAGHIWTSLVLNFVQGYPASEVLKFFRAQGQNIESSDENERFKLNLTVTRHLCKLSQKERGPVIKALTEKMLNDKRIIENELMSMEELRMLDPNLVSIASHSLTHPCFQHETDQSFIEHELADSKKILETELNVKVNAFAFPFACHNLYSLQVVRKYYDLCFTSINKPVDLYRLKDEKDYLFQLSRYNIHHGTAEETFLLINGFHSIFKSS